MPKAPELKIVGRKIPGIKLEEAKLSAGDIKGADYKGLTSEAPATETPTKKDFSREAVAIQCKTDVDSIEKLGKDKESGGQLFGYKNDKFKVLDEEDSSSTIIKSWRVPVEGKNYYVYLV